MGLDKQIVGVRASKNKESVTGVVTARDLKALHWVLHQGVMTVDQIYRAVYAALSTQSSRYAYKRVQFLEKAKYLTSVSSPHSKHRFLKVTKSAQGLLLARGVRDVTRNLYVPSVVEIPHSEVLTEIRIAIQESGKHMAGEEWWLSEGTLLEDTGFPKERFQDLMPDALWLTRTGRKVAIEFERTRKGISRIRKKVEGLEKELGRTDRAFDRVLWVSLEGAYRDLKSALGARESQTLRTVSEFLEELREK